MSVETVVKCATPTIGEGPHWDNATQSLLWIDMIDGILFKWNSRTKTYETHEFGKNNIMPVWLKTWVSYTNYIIYNLVYYLKQNEQKATAGTWLLIMMSYVQTI